MKPQPLKAMNIVIALLALLVTALPTYSQNKPIVAVSSIETSFTNYDTKNIQTAIETAIVQSGKYTLMERSRLDELLKEQGKSTGPHTGRWRYGRLCGR